MAKMMEMDIAKEQLVKFNDVLQKPYLLIGGLAVNQYDLARDSSHIDLVMSHQSAMQIIEQLDDSKDWEVFDHNEDEYHPSYSIRNRVDEGTTVVLFGPKILEFGPYGVISWDELKRNTKPFSYKQKKLKNIIVPNMETLAFTKLLSFLNRTPKSPRKGHQDLIDFIHLSNHVDFRLNALVLLIRQSNISAYIHEKLSKMVTYDTSLWNQSLFMDFIKIVTPTIENYGPKKHIFEDNFKRLYNLDESIEFYDEIAHLYDVRNTQFVRQTHKNIIAKISDILSEKSNKGRIKLLDLGAGTGIQIAEHFFHSEELIWHAVEPSKKMGALYKNYYKADKLDTKVFENSIFELGSEILSNKYDVIVISLVLSSLKEMPDFAQLCDLLTPQGSFIIADFNEASPFYDFEEANIALYTSQIPILTIMKEISDEGLFMKSIDLIDNTHNNGRTFVVHFKKNESLINS